MLIGTSCYIAIMKFVVKFFLVVLIILISCVIAYFLKILYLYSYKEFVAWVAHDLLKKPHIVKFIPKYFNETQFRILRAVSIVLIGAFFLFLGFLIKKRALISNSLVSKAQIIKFICIDFWQAVVPKEKLEQGMFWVVIILPFVIAVYNICTIPISYDESVSYIDFISNGPIVIGSLFHTTNNHILYNFLSYLSCLIFPAGEVAQRLPLLLIYLFNCLLLYGLLKKIVKPYVAIIGLSFFVLSTPVYVYSFMARGYLLVMFFVLISLYSCYQLLISSNRRYWAALFMSSVLGMYTIPVMAYLLLAVYVFLGIFFLINNKRKFVTLLKTAVYSVLTIGLLYTPIILVSGLGSLVQVIREVGSKLSVSENAIRNTELLTDFYISSNIYIKIVFGVILLTGIGSSLFYTNSQKRIFLFFLVLISVMPVLTTFLLSQKIFDRTWIYMIVPFTLFYSMAFSRIKSFVFTAIIIFCTLVIQFVSSSRNFYYASQKHQIYAARKASDLFVNNKLNSIYIDHLFVRPMIEYRLMVVGYKYELNIGSSVYRKSQFDTTRGYDMVVCTNYSKLPAFQGNYVMIDSVNEVRVFKLSSKK